MNWDVGKGVDYNSGTAKQSPFHMTGFTEQKSQATDKEIFVHQIVSSTETFSSYLDSKMSASSSGWGFSASVDIAASNDVSYQSNQVLLLAHRSIKYGFDGMKEGQLPPFTDEAKDFLCQDPEAFK